MLSLFKFLSTLFCASPIDVQDRNQKFLSEAVDMYDLEVRMRHLDGGHRGIYSGGPYGVHMR